MDVLFAEGISGHQEEKILIKLDAEPQEVEILPLSRPKLSEFKVEKFLRIPASPICFFS